ncbi:MAG TPA: SpoIIE family protein phosphatase [Streptomyces sp.]|nr:SpoIIE family protein phosphatase [Streptomyces sp.]
MAQTAGPDGASPGTAADRRGRSPGEEAASLLDSLHAAVAVLDLSGRVLLWSHAAQDLLGWTPEETLGEHVAAVLLPPAGDSAAEARQLTEALRGEEQWHGVLTARHRDGRDIPLEGRAAVLRTGDGSPVIVATAVEASRLRTIEHDLAACDALFASSPLGIAFIDTELRYVRINEALARLNGVPLAEHLGHTVHDVLPADVADEIVQIQTAVLRTGRPVVDILTPAPDGTGARSVSYSRLTDHRGRVLGLTCTVMDITERRDALQKVERARQRLALLDHVAGALRNLLDVRPTARAFARALVPGFADYAGVMLYGAVAYGGELPEPGTPALSPLLQLGVAARGRGPAVDRLLHVGQDIAFQPDSFFATALTTATPHLARSREELIAATYPGDPKIQAAIDLDIESLMAVPLSARGIVLGLLVISRTGGRDAFDDDDLALAVEIADRAGISLDNARLYDREREGALMLQRSLLPQHVPAPPGVRVAYRYVPGSSGAEVGGDWFDVIPLVGGRVAFVVGDVMGHGLQAAATMGRLRTAVRTLAGLDLSPEDLLQRVGELADDLTPSPDEPLMATCVYAVYDPGTRRCCLARAGHLPPLLLTRSPEGGRQAHAVDIPSGAPLGVGGVAFESAEFEVEEGAVLVLYTDGLIENRGEAITDGVDRLRGLLSTAPAAPASAARDDVSLEDACDTVISTLGSTISGHATDDVALLMAQLGGLPEGSSAAWTFPAESHAVRHARATVRRTLHEWGLAAIEDEAVLLVSELVTNSLRYAHGPIGVRMVRGRSLLVEVSDPLPDPPRPQQAGEEDEGGRGLQLVARSSRRWGTRHGAMGKTVWFELPLPG